MSGDTEHYTVVSFHAHPDDEALLTAGTLARAVAEGHRVVIVVATDGEAGLAGGGLEGDELRRIRREEMARSAEAIGAARVHFLGYADGGFDPRGSGDRPTTPDAFAAQPSEEVSRRLADILVDEDADVLTIYDEVGGYGHPDHIQINRVGLRAAYEADTPLVLEATVERETLHRALRWLRRLRWFLPTPELPDLGASFTPRARLTHRVDVREYLPAKIRALEAHRSQTGGGETVRTIALLLRLPRPLRAWALGTEWFREVGCTPSVVLFDDIFRSLRRERQGHDGRPGPPPRT